MLRRIRFVGLALALVGGCQVTHTDDGGGGPSGPTLREFVDVDLSQTTALVYVRPTQGRASPAPLGPTEFRDADGGLFGLDAMGEATPIELLDGDPSDVVVMAIFSTADWVFLLTGGQQVAPPDDPEATIDCRTFAVRRVDARLFCSPLGLSFSQPWDAYPPIQQNLAGTMGVWSARDSVGNSILYRVDFDPEAGPVASLIDEFVNPRLFLLNADGDAFVTHQPSPLDDALASLVYPDAAPPATPVSGTNNSFVATGEPGTAEADTFFVANGGNAQNFDGVLRRVRKTADGFVEDEVALELAEAGFYGDLLRLSDGTYMINSQGRSLARVVDGGEIVTNPAVIPIEGLDEIVNSPTIPSYVAGDGLVTILGRVGESTVFVRHDGQSQVNLPVPVDLAIQQVSFARSGAIEFIARDLVTNEYVRGRFAADSTELVVTPSDLLRPDDVVAFTALN